MSNTYRAAYIPADAQRTRIRLTDEDQAHLEDEHLMAQAKKQAAAYGLEDQITRIVIGEWAE